MERTRTQDLLFRTSSTRNRKTNQTTPDWLYFIYFNLFSFLAKKIELRPKIEIHIFSYTEPIRFCKKHSLGSFSQKVQLEEGKLYSFSAWVQVKNESEDVAVVFRRANGELIRGGRVTAMDGCWSFLKAGIVANFSSGPADFLFECLITTFYNGGMDIPPRPKYSEESVQGRENYAVADAMVKFAQVHGIRIRGHNIFWDDPRYQPSWEKNLSPNQLRVSAEKRINFAVSRYKREMNRLGFLNYWIGCGRSIWILEQVLRESHSHPAVKGIIIWPGPAVAGFSKMTLADINFRNTRSGYVVDKLISGWKFQTAEIKADSEGSFEVTLFYGDYDITVEGPLTNSSPYLNYKLTEHDTRDTVDIHINAE
ncbi:hypothetical protein JCGZ_16339 [Jatropha curcas]|uniref:GH10 domain-containing protein n=1 Tax=Jatropha curcas TaxID=180498 RepID=A0A067L7R2_JATCU|nr:hypothetical protein JCGZ_16339 [Jatropha curcas]